MIKETNNLWSKKTIFSRHKNWMLFLFRPRVQFWNRGYNATNAVLFSTNQIADILYVSNKNIHDQHEYEYSIYTFHVLFCRYQHQILSFFSFFNWRYLILMVYLKILNCTEYFPWETITPYISHLQNRHLLVMKVLKRCL